MTRTFIKAYTIFLIGLFVLAILTTYIYNVVSKPGNYFRIGTTKSSKTYLRSTPEYEYQLFIEDDYIVIESFGRLIDTVHLDSAGQVGEILIKDNE
jgi:hypothetical protein